MLSGVFFFNERGDMILGRFYRPDIHRVATDAFRSKILLPRKFAEPIVMIEGYSFLYIRYNTIYVVAATGMNGNPTLIFEFLYETVDLLRTYFNDKFDEITFRANFTLIYELLDEIMDHGFPQITSADILQEYIKTYSSVKSNSNSNSNSSSGQPFSLKARLLKLKSERKKKRASSALGQSSEGNKITQAITGRMDWRPPSTYAYPKNEVYLDVLESINLLMSRTGDVLQMSCDGKVMMKTALSGMPEARIGINDKLCLDPKQLTTQKGQSFINLNDIKLHRCVRLGKFDEDRSIMFVPPDGEFQLMRYTVSKVSQPFHIYPHVIERGGSRIEYRIKVEATFNPKMFASEIVVLIPCPHNTSNCQFKTSVGKIKYEPTDSAMVWKIKKLYGNQSAVMKGEVALTRLMVDKAWNRPPIRLKFEVRMLASSGMKIRYLKITEKSLNYKTAKWVRYITSAGSYQIRI